MNPMIKYIAGGVIALLALISVPACSETVDPGQVAVGVFFGSVRDKTLDAGFHWPVNFFTEWEHYSIQSQTIAFNGIGLPARDRMISDADVTVFYRNKASSIRHIRVDVGTQETFVNEKVVPSIRSAMRDAGKTVTKSENYYDDIVLAEWTSEVRRLSNEKLADWGVVIEQINVRHIELPASIKEAVDATKAAEQEIAKATAQAKRYEAEQMQMVFQSKAKADSAEEEKRARQTQADAAAYEITAEAEAKANAVRMEIEASGGYENYRALRALQTLETMSRNPASQLFWMDSDSVNPLPLMNLTDRK